MYTIWLVCVKMYVCIDVCVYRCMCECMMIGGSSASPSPPSCTHSLIAVLLQRVLRGGCCGGKRETGGTYWCADSRVAVVRKRCWVGRERLGSARETIGRERETL